MNDNYNKIVNNLEEKKEKFKENSKSASDAMRLIVSALLFPTLALAYKDNSFSLGHGNPLIYPLFFFCLYFFADLFQFIVISIAIQVEWDEKNWVRFIHFAFFYGKFIFGLIGLIYLIISVLR
jgi:hypothetical protein